MHDTHTLRCKVGSIARLLVLGDKAAALSWMMLVQRHRHCRLKGFWSRLRIHSQAPMLRACLQVLGVNFAGATRGVELKLGIALGPNLDSVGWR